MILPLYLVTMVIVTIAYVTMVLVAIALVTKALVTNNLNLNNPGEGIVGRTFYYSSATNCQASALNGHILNCGNKDDGDDFIYKWSHPGSKLKSYLTFLIW